MTTEITVQELRKLELVEAIMDYLSDWQEDVTRNLSKEQNLFEIVGYCDGFNLDDVFVIAAIRHAQYIINFMNKSALREWLYEIGFTSEEGDYYFTRWINGEWSANQHNRICSH